MLDCWKMNPMTRPSFTDLAERLGDLLQDSTKSVSNISYSYIIISSSLALCPKYPTLSYPTPL